MNRTKSILGLVAAILVSQLAGLIGGVFTAASVRTWYTGLHKPPLNPPSWVFGPVWTLLYTLMGIAAWLVWRQGTHRRDVRIGLWLFGTQLALNALWSVIFFGLRSPGWAFAELIVLWVAILATMIQSFRVSTTAGLLFAPYQLWVSFAAVLNYCIWRLNA